MKDKAAKEKEPAKEKDPYAFSDESESEEQLVVDEAPRRLLTKKVLGSPIISPRAKAVASPAASSISTLKPGSLKMKLSCKGM